jgi:hypothetical protein
VDSEKFIAAAKAGIVTVVFEKINGGGTRIMECTLNPEVSDGNVQDVFEQQPQNDHLAVWALDKGAWRSFRVSTVIEWYEGKPKSE